MVKKIEDRITKLETDLADLTEKLSRIIDLDD